MTKVGYRWARWWSVAWVGVAFAALLVWLYLPIPHPTADAGPSAVDAPLPSGLPDPGPSPEDTGSLQVEAATLLPGEPQVRTPVPDAARAGWATIQGVCTWLDGRPVPTGRVRVDTYATEGDLRLSLEREDPVRSDGAFTVRVAAGPGVARRISVFAAGCVTRTKMLPPLERDQVVDLGTVHMYVGSLLRGRIVNGDGSSVGAGKVRLKALEVPPPDQMEDGYVKAVTLHAGDDGRFESPRLLRRGVWSVSVLDMGALAVEPERVELDEATEVIEVRVQLGPRIQGRVLDAAGQPVARLQWQAEDPATNRRVSAISLPCGADGSFVLVPEDPTTTRDLVRLSLLNAGESVYCAQGGPLVAWGSAGLVLFVDKKPTVKVSVKDAESGAPIEDFAVSLWPDRSLVWRLAGKHDGGVCRIVAEQNQGRAFLSVTTRDLHHLPSAWQEVTVAPGPEVEFSVSLQRARSWRVRVISSSSAAVQGAEVAVVLAPAPCSGAEVLAARSGFEPDNLFGYAGVGPVVLGRASSDANGNARVMAPGAMGGNVWLRVTAPGVVPQVVAVAPSELQRMEWEVVVGAGAVVSGRVVARRRFEGDVAVGLCRLGQGSAAIGSAEQVQLLAADGGFRFPTVAAGPWCLVLQTPGRGRVLGTLQEGFLVEQGKACELGSLAADGPWPARISGVIVVGGETPLGGVVKVRRLGAPEVVEEVRVGAAGEWTVPGLLPGTYAVQLEWRGERHAVEPAVEIGPGADVRLSRRF